MAQRKQCNVSFYVIPAKASSNWFAAFVSPAVAERDYFSTMESANHWRTSKWSCCSHTVFIVFQVRFSSFCLGEILDKTVNSIKGVVDCFFLGLIVFMGCSLTCVNASFKKKKKNIIFHIIYLYSTPLCPFSDKRTDNFLLLWSPSLRNTRLVRCPSALWLAKPPLVCV